MRASVAVAVVAIVACVAGARPAWSQEDRSWLVLRSSTGGAGEDWPSLPARLVSGLEVMGAAPRDPDGARRLYEARASAEPAPVDRTELEQLQDRIGRAMVLVATGQRQGALREMSDGMELMRRASETINREAAVARRAFDGCLVTVRALIELRQRGPARDRARECQRLFPDIVPNPREHPPWVIGWLAEVRAEAEAGARGSLRVDSSPSGCAVYLQGMRVGTTPFERGDFSPGEQRIQVECAPGRPGRVHRVVLGAQATFVRIDTIRDAAIRTTDGLELRYGTAEEENRRRLGDGLAVARVLDASDLLLVTPEQARVRLDRVSLSDGRALASARLPMPPSDEDIRQAVRALMRGESLEVGRGPTEPWTPPGGGPPARIPAPPERPARAAAGGAGEPPDEASGPGLPGVSLVVAGAVSLGTGFALTALSVSDWDVAAGAAGGLLLTISVPFVMPDGRGVPWWAWGLGLAGAALGAASVYAIAIHGECEVHYPDGPCAARRRTGGLGSLLLASAAPLLSVPIVAAVRPGGDASAGAAVSLSRRGARLTLVVAY